MLNAYRSRLSDERNSANERRANGEFAARWYIYSVMGGWIVEAVYGMMAEADYRTGIRTFCLLWFASAAAFFAGTISGFLFSIPKAVLNAAGGTTHRYRPNTNLEDVSDWLTKIILGLSLVHIDKIINLLSSVGDQVGAAMGQAQGAKAIAISAMIYGAVCGFLAAYIWTRGLRRDFERDEGPPVNDQAPPADDPALARARS
ncbi:hypothetical protein IC762_08775 [Bradyrhizobium genosp. L]|nr:hypothetical protein IC762_08775 [Bradyrhizobium genosp. L]